MEPRQPSVSQRPERKVFPRGVVTRQAVSARSDWRVATASAEEEGHFTAPNGIVAAETVRGNAAVVQ